MQFSKNQMDVLARYFSDLSKILFASFVVGFFVSSDSMLVTVPVFGLGVIATLTALATSVGLAK